MPTLQVTGINICPLKSGQKIEVKNASFDPLGIENDRRWAVIDSKTKVVRTQRNYEKLALVISGVGPDYISLSAPGMTELIVPKKGNVTDGFEAKLFSRKVLVIDQGEKAEKWLSEFLGHDVKLVYQPLDLARNGIALVDDRPVLIISENSLNDLNVALKQRGVERYLMNRFRPNFETAVTKPYQEDEWREILIGDVKLEGKGACERCQLPDIDQALGEYSDPTREIKIVDILKQHRGTEKAIFGQYFHHMNVGTVHVGDEIQVLQ